ncbi:hypothetical protein, partial [Nostoc sp. LEGE 06077]|uniref:hypothetical protein n=1 Tax=Nostoc sp. LEGE 06077 TaxID=915325 RepID=UPI001D15DDD8
MQFESESANPAENESQHSPTRRSFIKRFSRRSFLNRTTMLTATGVVVGVMGSTFSSFRKEETSCKSPMSVGKVAESFLDIYELRKGKEPQTRRIQTAVWCASG